MAPIAKLCFFVQLSCIEVFNIFGKFLFFWYSNGPKIKFANLFSLKIKSSEKQKCVYKLFQSKLKFYKE